MKRNLPAFLSGVLTATLVGSITLSALAISGRMTIEVDPVNVQVNGAVFAPKDANGREVPVFAYEGTTYAPLRALAEAYGLEVGYDANSNMATVGKVDDEQTATSELTPTPDTTAKTDYSDLSADDEAAYQEFKEMWDVEPPSVGADGQMSSTAICWLVVDIEELNAFLKNNTEDTVLSVCRRMDTEVFENTFYLNMAYKDKSIGVLWRDMIGNGGDVWFCEYSSYLNKI